MVLVFSTLTQRSWRRSQRKVTSSYEVTAYQMEHANCDAYVTQDLSSEPKLHDGQNEFNI